MMRCAIWYILYNLKNVKNTYGGMLLLVKLQAKSNTPQWLFFTFLKLYKWYQSRKTSGIWFYLQNNPSLVTAPTLPIENRVTEDFPVLLMNYTILINSEKIKIYNAVLITKSSYLKTILHYITNIFKISKQ